MKILSSAIALIFVVTACGKKAEEAKPGAAAADPKAGSAKVGDAPATAKTGGELSCDAVLPAATRDKYMKGATIEGQSPLARSLMCSGKRGDAVAYQVTVDCRVTSSLAQFQEQAAEEVKNGRTELAGLGRAAYGDETQAYFYDDDADCVVTASTYVEGEKVADLAKQIAATLSPAMLPPLEKGKYTLDCDKLLPKDLRAAHMAGAKLKRDSIMTDQMACKFETPDFKTTEVSYSCSGDFGGDFLKQTKEQLVQGKMEVEDVAIGSGALYSTMMGTHSVTLVDAETGCLVMVMTMSGDKAGAIALAKKTEAALTVESAQ